MRELVEKGLSRYSVDVDLLRQLAPNVIITQDACQVCAVSLDDLQHACGAYLQPEGEGGSCKIISLHPLTVRISL